MFFKFFMVTDYQGVGQPEHAVAFSFNSKYPSLMRSIDLTVSGNLMLIGRGLPHLDTVGALIAMRTS